MSSRSPFKNLSDPCLRGSKWLSGCLFFLVLRVLLGASAYAQGTIQVRFAQPVYTIQPGGTIPVDVVIAPAPAAGLFSYGVSIGFDPARVLLERLGIQVPKDLDFNGVLGPGALKAAGESFAAVKGTVNFSTLAIQPYTDSLLATVLVTDKSQSPGASYVLDLSAYRTLGSTETIFVDGSGHSLDDQITFGTTRINVVPEPSPLALGTAAAIVLVLTRIQHARTGSRPSPAPGSRE